MVKCRRKKCKTSAGFGTKNTTEKKFCRKHKGPSDVDNNHPRDICAHTKCISRGYYGERNNDDKYCHSHKSVEHKKYMKKKKKRRKKSPQPELPKGNEVSKSPCDDPVSNQKMEKMEMEKMEMEKINPTDPNDAPMYPRIYFKDDEQYEDYLMEEYELRTDPITKLGIVCTCFSIAQKSKNS